MTRRAILMLIAVLAVSACGGTEPTSSQLSASQPRQGAAGAAATSIAIYDDALATGWADWSWATHSLANTTPVAAGTRSIAVTFAPWTGLTSTAQPRRLA